MAIYDLLYLFEYYIINKIGGTNNPYACEKWHGIQIPQAILSLIDRKGLQFTFLTDKREEADHILLFYEHNQVEHGLDFDDFPEDKPDFIRYAVKIRCLNLKVDTKKTPLPPLEDLAEGVAVLLTAGLQHNKEPRKELEKLLQTEGVSKECVVLRAIRTMHSGPPRKFPPRSGWSNDPGQDPRSRRGYKCYHLLQDNNRSGRSNPETDA